MTYLTQIGSQVVPLIFYKLLILSEMNKSRVLGICLILLDVTDTRET